MHTIVCIKRIVDPEIPAEQFTLDPVTKRQSFLFPDECEHEAHLALDLPYRSAYRLELRAGGQAS